MDKKKITKNLSLFIFYIFALIGVITISTILHEYSHKEDYGKISSNGEIALFIIPDDISFKEFILNGAIAKYNYEYYSKDIDEENRISKYTEFKAYGISLLIFLLFLIVQIVVIYNWLDLTLK